MVSAAAVWDSLPFSSTFVGPLLTPAGEGRGGALSPEEPLLLLNYTVSEQRLERLGLRTLETVEVGGVERGCGLVEMGLNNWTALTKTKSIRQPQSTGYKCI